MLKKLFNFSAFFVFIKKIWAKRLRFYPKIAAKTAPFTAKILLKQMQYLDLPDQFYHLFREKNYWLLKDHYYRPFTNAKLLSPDYWSREFDLPGIDMNVESCLDYAENNLKKYFEEFRQTFPIEKPKENFLGKFWLINGTYMAVDAHMYYALIRDTKHRRAGNSERIIVEIGAGQSTLVAAEASRRNNIEGIQTELICIEPYPNAIVSTGLDKVANVMVSRVEDVNLSFFKQLQEGDILFIDSTHALKEGGDVQYIYGQILPILKPGVLVHIHDVSLPKPYPKVYLDYGWFWNEQYLLQAYLTHNSKVDVIWPGNYLMCKSPDLMNTIFPEIAIMRGYFPSSEPSAFWFKTK